MAIICSEYALPFALRPSSTQEIFPEHLPAARLCWALGDQSLADTVVPALEESAEGQCPRQVRSVICGMCLRWALCPACPGC